VSVQQWQLPRGIDPRALDAVPLPLPLKALLFRRGLTEPDQVHALLSDSPLPTPDGHFPELDKAVQRLHQACLTAESVAICGDYDADGMTSTALLLRTLRTLGAEPQAAIPSRMADGYGLNCSMVNELHADGVRLIVTVDNGVAAHEALSRAEDLGIEVVLTDHHTLPKTRPKALALIHPATTPEHSPYRGLAGVGLAYVVARELAERMRQPAAIASARDLFCIGTVADMAPLTGANRTLLREGLLHLHQSNCPGVRALQQLAGLGDRPLRADDIGFQLAPRINAVGRIGDPQLVVDLLTADDQNSAIELGRQCDSLNRQRRELCDAIEAEALALLESDRDPLPPFLLLAQGHWHHGVIGIVAARLMERFQRPTALLAADGDGLMRASVRAPEGFAVDKALDHCTALLERHGGHPAAGGFTVKAEHVHRLHEELNGLALSWIQTRGEGILVAPEALLSLSAINHDLWSALLSLEPFGIGHPAPLFWSRGCKVTSQRLLRGGHLKLTLGQGDCEREAIAWRWQQTQPLPAIVDVAYRISLNRWQGEAKLQLEIQALREHHAGLDLHRGLGVYRCTRPDDATVVIENPSGERLSGLVNRNGVFETEDSRAGHPYVADLIRDACIGLGLLP
jgi:single-stranded-DNA-specific exonuclease